MPDDLQQIVQRMVAGGERESDIALVIQHYKATQPAAAQAQPDTSPKGSAAGRFLSGAGEMLNPVTMVKGLAQAAAHPIDTGKALFGAQVDQGRQAVDLYRQGRYTEAAGHAGAAALPILGPVAANAGERIASGDVAGGLGESVGLLAGIAAPGAIRGVKGVRVTPGMRPANPVAAEAVAFGERAGIPLDAATATGNRAVRAVQHVVDRSLGGSLVAEKAGQAQAQGLATLGEQLAAKGYKSATTAEQAGEGVRGAVLDQVRGHAADANAAYGKLRAIEADPKHLKVVTVMEEGRAAGGGTVKVPIQQEIALPVDLRSVKTALRPMFDELMARYPIAQQEASKGLKALANIVQGPDYAALSTVDANLGAIKSIARTDLPELRSVSQGTAAGAVKQLDAAVRRTAAEAGPDALKALESGRTSTVAKYGAGDVLDTIRAEPVKAHGQLTAPKDGAIAQLRAVAKQAPAELPKIGRAVLDDLLATATKDGGFGSAQTIATKWAQLGPETKRLLYKDPGYIQDLDRFFHLAKLAAKDANPSGTAHTLMVGTEAATLVTAPMVGIPASVGMTAAAKLLHSPAGVKLLTRGLRIPVGNKAARAAWTAEVTALTSPSGSQSPTAAPVPAR